MKSPGMFSSPLYPLAAITTLCFVLGGPATAKRASPMVEAARSQVTTKVFSPGVISSAAHDSAPAFSPDGDELYVGRSTPAASMILVTHRVRRGWSSPQIASFSGRWLDMEPAMSPDGSYLIFVSNRPAAEPGNPIDGQVSGKAQMGRGGNLWRVDRKKGGWSEPVRLPNVINSVGSVYAPSIAADGTLFFMKPSTSTGRFQIFSARKLPTGYAEPTSLPFSDGSTTDVDPAVSPDQSFMIFGSGRYANTDIDLYIVYREESGWGTPLRLPEPINSETSDAEPRLGPENRTLYFSSEKLEPVPSPITGGRSSDVAEAMITWNNGLYNIWMADLRAILSNIPKTEPVSEVVATPDEVGVRKSVR